MYPFCPAILVRTPVGLFPVDRAHLLPRSNYLDEPKAIQVLYLFPLYKVRVSSYLFLTSRFRHQAEKSLITSFELPLFFLLRKLLFTMSDRRSSSYGH
jgi:hypothetical protein